MTLAENAEVANLRAVAGEYDYQERHIDLAKLPTFLENAQRGNYTVHLDLGYNGSDTNLIFTLGYKADPEIGKLIATPDFRRALSLGIDRDQVNDAFFLGLGTPGSVVPAEDGAEPGTRMARPLGDARSRAGQRDARQDRADPARRRGLQAAPRQRRAAATDHRCGPRTATNLATAG